MITREDLANGYIARAIAERAVTDIKSALRERIMRDVNSEVDAIIEAVLNDLKVESSSWRSPATYDALLVTDLTIHWKGEKL